MTSNARDIAEDIGGMRESPAAPFFAGGPLMQFIPQQMPVRLQVAAMLLQGLLGQHIDVEREDGESTSSEPMYRMSSGEERDRAIDDALSLADQLIAATK